MNVLYDKSVSVTKMQLCLQRSKMHRTNNDSLDYTILLVSIWICWGQVCGYSCSTIRRHNQNLHTTTISHVTRGNGFHNIERRPSPCLRIY